MCKILCSTGALVGRPNNRDYRLLEQLSRQLTCDGFEFMMYSTWYEEKDELVSALQSMELYIPVMHCEKHIVESTAFGDDGAVDVEMLNEQFGYIRERI